MRLKTKIAVTAGALALTVSPAAFAMGKPEGTPPHGHGGTHAPEAAPEHETGGGSGANGTDYAPGEPTPGPKAGLPAKAKAYGRYCKGESRKHEKGEKGTEFSRCVTNMAQAANHKAMAPGRVCKGESRKHEKGEKGTEFSRCVRNVNQLRRQERREEHQKKKEERQEEHAEGGNS